jgi:tetratricopeptide (TPR) repeat protein
MSAAVSTAEPAAPPRILLAGLLLLGLVAESVYFGYRTMAAVARMDGERAYFSGDHTAAWKGYERSSRLGGPPEALALDRAELLLNGLDMQNLGVKVTLPLPPEQVLPVAEGLVRRLLGASPFRAYYWSLAADLYLNEAQAHRRSTPLDLSTLSEDPRENLRPEEILAVAALEEAVRREPHNYIYEDILAEQLLQWNLPDLAAPHVRRGVALYPLLNSHIHLSRPRLDPAIVEAAVQGFDDAFAAASMIASDTIECDAGKFLLGQGRHAEAVAFLERALAINPKSADALGQIGIAEELNDDHAQAIGHLERAVKELPDSPYLWYYLGQAKLKTGDHAGGREGLRRARETDPKNVQLFHAYADLLEADGALKDAERQFQAAANTNPSQNAAWRALLGFYQRHPDLRRTGTRQVCARLAGLKSARDVHEEWCKAPEMGPR